MFEIKSGVMQGSKLDPLLSISFLNDLLFEIESHDLVVEIGDLENTLLSFADYIILITISAETLQKLIDIRGTWTRCNCMKFKMSNCKVMTSNLNTSPTSFHLLGQIRE